jgi:hypothetical protein
MRMAAFEPVYAIVETVEVVVPFLKEFIQKSVWFDLGLRVNQERSPSMLQGNFICLKE